jgi:hypothetical protein
MPLALGDASQNETTNDVIVGTTSERLLHPTLFAKIAPTHVA